MGRGSARHRPPARPQAARALRRRAAAGRPRAGDRPRALASSCSTSRSRTSTPSCAPRPARSSSSSSGASRTTMIYVTHDQVEAMAMGDRVVVMNHGRVRQIGTPAEVYDDPADTLRRDVPRLAPDEPRRERRRPSSGSVPSTSFRPNSASTGARVPFSLSHRAARSTSAPSASSTATLEGGRFAGKRVVSRMSRHATRPVPAAGSAAGVRRRRAASEVLRPETATGLRRDPRRRSA